MDPIRFDRLAQSIARARSRRGLIIAFAGAVAAAETGLAQRRRKKCRDVGRRCRDNGDCCSGKCKGTRRNSRCVGHDSGGCEAGNTACRTPPETCTTSLGDSGGCLTTTGNGGYCAATGECASCNRDADCREAFGKRAACVVCDNCSSGTACAGPRA
ncbi:MAG: hypothetical protein ACRDJC_24455 [Thermomicrobiales bacterium]